MGRRGYSTTIGKFAKVHHNRRLSEMRLLGELLRNTPVPLVEQPKPLNREAS